jgi:hypothetical protein
MRSGNAGELRLVADIQAVVVGRIEHVVLEPRSKIRELLFHGLEARLASRIQLGAGEPEIPKLVLDQLFLRGLELREIGRCGKRLVTAEQPLVLAEFGMKRRDLRQIRVVRFAQRGRVDHGIEVIHLSPRAIEAILNVGKRLDEALPGRRRGASGDALDRRPRLGEEEIDSRTDVLGRYLSEARQACEVEQRIACEGFVLGVHGEKPFTISTCDRAAPGRRRCRRSPRVPCRALR